MRIVGRLFLLIPWLGMAACGSSSMPGSTLAPTNVTTSTSAAPAPTITAISPALGSTGGAARIIVTGTGLSTAATASFGGGAAVTGLWDPHHVGTLLNFFTQAHAPGTVDVIVTNPDGQSVRLNAAFTFVPPQSFDFNGNWSGYSQDIDVLFTIRNDALVSVSCDPYATRTFSPPLPVTNGEFSYVGDGVIFSGRMAAASEATGTIRLGPCASDAWDAYKL